MMCITTTIRTRPVWRLVYFVETVRLFSRQGKASRIRRSLIGHLNFLSLVPLCVLVFERVVKHLRRLKGIRPCGCFSANSGRCTSTLDFQVQLSLKVKDRIQPHYCQRKKHNAECLEESCQKPFANVIFLRLFGIFSSA